VIKAGRLTISNRQTYTVCWNYYTTVLTYKIENKSVCSNLKRMLQTSWEYNMNLKLRGSNYICFSLSAFRILFD